MIPDPVELMESRQERLAYEWNVAQRGVPEGQFRCAWCNRVFDYEPIQVSAAPDSPAMCYECLPDDAKKAYDDFQESDRE